MSTDCKPEKAALWRVAKAAGSQAALASALGYKSRRNVWPWFKGGRRVPAEHCPTIERLYGVRCEELRPDVEWHVLRQRAAANDGAEAANEQFGREHFNHA